MTKLGITPAVHGGEGGEEKAIDTVEAVKTDPKVFTVLQPTVIPIHAPPQPARPHRSAGSVVLRGILLFLLFVACFTAGMVIIYGVDTIYTGIYGSEQSTSTAAPAFPGDQLGLIQNPMGNNDQKDQKPAENEMKILLNTVPGGKVMVIEGGNGAMNVKDMQEKELMNDGRPMHPYEQQEAPLEAFNNRPMINQPQPPFWVLQLQLRQMAQAQAMHLWRLRRLQQAAFEQQMMRQAMLRAEWAQMEQQRRAALEEQLAKAIAQARWEQTQRARAMEEYQAEVQRAQWAEAQRAQMERAQMAQLQQQQHQQQQYWQQWWPRHQQQQQQMLQEPQQWFYFPQQQQQLQQQLQYNRIQQPQLIVPQQPQPLQQQIPTRPHDASPAQILSMQQPTVPPAPEMGMHDKIYQEMQKKSQNMEFNAPSRPIWTAITPTPETPTGNYDHDAIFQENLKKINEMSSTTSASPSTPAKVAEIKQVEGENMFRDILSVFDEAEKKDSTTPTTTGANVFKAFEDDKKSTTETSKAEKEEAKEMVDSATQVDMPTENIFKTVDQAKPEESIFKTMEEAKPEENNFKNAEQTTSEVNDLKTMEDLSPEEIQIPEEDAEGPVGPVVIEDRFPRIGDRTTVPVEVSTGTTTEVESDKDMEHDPLATFLRYFEQEAQKMHQPKPKASTVVDSEVRREEPKAGLPAAVDEPEPHFQPGFQNIPKIMTA